MFARGWDDVFGTALWDDIFSVTFCRSVVFFGNSRFFHQDNTDHHDVTEILFKVALNTISCKSSNLKLLE
jgi:hypothetical protein